MSSLTRDLLRGVNEALDEHNLSSLERTHIPRLDVPDRIEPGKPVRVGVLVDSNGTSSPRRGHFIHSLELYADRTELARVDFLPGHSIPTVELTVLLPPGAGELSAVAHCTMHGSWIGRVKLQYSDD
ncbi:MAG: desulfoferrodoxin family protein [Phycisphaerae bacterium]